MSDQHSNEVAVSNSIIRQVMHRKCRCERTQQQFYILILYYRGGYGYPSQNTFVPYNLPLYSMQGGQHNQPILPYAQQLLSYNQNPNNTELAHNDPSILYPQYPLLNNHNAYNSYNSLPYGDWVIRQAQQNFPPPIMNSYPVNAGYTMNSQYQPDNTQTEKPQNSTKENEEPATPRKVSTNKAAKRSKGPKFDPRSVYGEAETRAPWGSKTWDGQHLFTYTKRGQLLRDRKLNNEQLREYVDNCPKGTVFRVQQYPTGCRYRMGPEDQECRWEHCPLKSKRITTGWLRVCFDEFPMETTSGERDPLLCAGSMHLWCFEQVFDPVEFYLGGRLKAETRYFPREECNKAALDKLTDSKIVEDGWKPWFDKWAPLFESYRRLRVPRKYENTLSYALNDYHVKHQSDARENARNGRHEKKINKEDPRRTIDVHLGNLQLYVALHKVTKATKRASRPPEREMREDLPDGGFESPDTSRKRISPPPAPRAKRTGSAERMAPCLPIGPSLGTSSSHISQTQRRSPRGSDLKRTSPRRLKKELRRHILASQPPVDRGHNPSMDSCSSASTSTGYLNTNSTPSSSFGPLDSACSTLPSSNLRPPLEIAIPSNHNEGGLAKAYPSVYLQAMSGPSFNMEDPKQPGHFIGPPSWRYQQQQYSSTVALPYVKAEHQRVFQDCNLNTPLEASRGSDLVKPCQNETKTWTPKAAEEAPQALGDSEGISSIDSNQFTGLGPEEANLYQFLIIDEDVPESTQNPAEGSTGVMGNFAAQTQTNAAASQPLEFVTCTESPHVAAVAEPWHSVESFMDPMNYGGYSNTDIFPLFDDSLATA